MDLHRGPLQWPFNPKLGVKTTGNARRDTGGNVKGPSELSRQLQGKRWQYSLQGVGIVFVGLALVLAIARTDRGTWFDGVIYLAALAVAVGLLQQGRDIRRALHTSHGMPAPVLLGWRFAVLWRIAVALILIGCWLVEYLIDVQVVDWEPEGDYDRLYFPGSYVNRFGVLLIWLVVALCSTPWGIPRPRNLTKLSRLRRGATGRRRPAIP
jgi:hypothetical protein